MLDENTINRIALDQIDIEVSSILQTECTLTDYIDTLGAIEEWQF